MDRYVVKLIRNFYIEDAYIFDLKEGKYIHCDSTDEYLMEERCEYLNAREELIKELENVSKRYLEDPEEGHIIADQLLLKYIDDKEVEQAYDKVSKWYA